MLDGKIVKWGNSQGVRLSKAVLKQAGIDFESEGVEIMIDVKDEKIIIEKKQTQSKLKQRMGSYDYKKYISERNGITEEIKPVGRELW